MQWLSDVQIHQVLEELRHRGTAMAVIGTFPQTAP
jgi:prephenate dehydratase